MLGWGQTNNFGTVMCRCHITKEEGDMGKREIESDKVNINAVFSKFWFIVPEYQRSYLWQRDNISDLLDDLWFAFENKSDSEYFLGSLVLQKRKEKMGGDIEIDVYDILDGQQRLTTLLMLMAILRDLSENEDNKRATQDAIFQKGSKVKRIPGRLRVTYKIRDNVEDFIRRFILEEKGTLGSSRLEGESEAKNISISNMAKAILTMHGFFRDKNRGDIENFVDFLFNDVVFIYVATENREDAFKLFTIINSRGISLTNANILKAINIGAIESDEEKERYANIWESIENEFGAESFERFLSFIRTILVKEKARTSLLEEFEKNIYGNGKLNKGKATIGIIEEYKEIYDKVVNFGGLDIDNDYKNLITIMKMGLPSEDWIPPLLLFYKEFEKEKLLELLRKLEYKFSSDWILQYTPTQRIENMNSILKKIEESESPDKVLAGEELFKVNNKSLREALSGDIYGRRFARYILLKYEYLISDNTVHLSDYKNITVEHILPQNPPERSQWRGDFTEDERNNWTDKLANLVLISKRKNSKLGNQDFDQKKEKYLKGRIDIFTGSKVFIEQRNNWTPGILERRQEDVLDELIYTET